MLTVISVVCGLPDLFPEQVYYYSDQIQHVGVWVKLSVKLRLHYRFFLVAVGFFLSRVNGHFVCLAARLHDEVFSR